MSLYCPEAIDPEAIDGGDLLQGRSASGKPDLMVRVYQDL